MMGWLKNYFYGPRTVASITKSIGTIVANLETYREEQVEMVGQLSEELNAATVRAFDAAKTLVNFKRLVA